MPADSVQPSPNTARERVRAARIKIDASLEADKRMLARATNLRLWFSRPNKIVTKPAATKS